MKLVTFLWGVAEATFFFIVPDVALTFIGAVDLKRGMQACLYATAGALVGGVILFAWGDADREAARAAMDRVPAVSAEMLDTVEEQLESSGPLATFVGAFSGTPYKLYAVSAPGAGIGLIPFLLVGAGARLLRFGLVTWVVGGILARLGRGKPPWRRLTILAVLWTIFYVVFFTVMPG